MKIAFLGPEGSYSHLAAQSFLKTEAPNEVEKIGWDECIPFRNFAEVLAAVSSGRVDGAALPIENSLQGGVLLNGKTVNLHIAFSKDKAKLGTPLIFGGF